MPRTNPISKKDREIAARIREIRLRQKCPRSFLASRAGVSAGFIARIELARAPLKYTQARDIFSTLQINPLWAATGEGFPHGYAYMPSVTELQISPKLTFSEVFDRFMPHPSSAFDASRNSLQLRSKYAGMLANMVHEWFQVIPDDQVEKLNDLLWNSAQDFIAACPEQMPEDLFKRRALYKSLFPSPAAKEHLRVLEQLENVLTSNSPKSKSGDVKSEVEKLIERVKQKASQPGAKAKLARALGVAPARISEWLSGEKEPGGEYTLRLLRWVEQSAS